MTNKHLAMRLIPRANSEFIRFCVVGLSGVFVNVGAYVALTRPLGWPIVLAAPVAIELSILWCFYWNDRWTFDGRAKSSSFLGRLLRFHAVCAVGGIANYAILLFMVDLFGWYDVYANLFGIVASVFIKYVANSIWTWRETPARGLPSGS